MAVLFFDLLFDFLGFGSTAADTSDGATAGSSDLGATAEADSDALEDTIIDEDDMMK
jgi:hypothetical protein